ncbi:MAG: 30S ribosomal protein S16 [Acidimicrobiia bacterium]
MAVRIRLTRKGKKRHPSYRVVVADSRSPRDGKYIEQIGRYDPRQEPSVVEVDNERALYWLSQGAQPSDAVRKLLEISGALSRREGARPEMYVVGGSDAVEPEAAAGEDAEAPAELEAAAEEDGEAPAEPAEDRPEDEGRT